PGGVVLGGVLVPGLLDDPGGIDRNLALVGVQVFDAAWLLGGHGGLRRCARRRKRRGWGMRLLQPTGPTAQQACEVAHGGWCDAGLLRHTRIRSIKCPQSSSTAPI